MADDQVQSNRDITTHEEKNEIEQIKQDILSALETVIDPELGIDIVNLGLVYDVDLDEEGLCTVKMTLTTMGCPLADVLTEEVHRALISLDAVKDTAVELVWYPAWTPDRMSRFARISLGIGR